MYGKINYLTQNFLKNLAHIVSNKKFKYHPSHLYENTKVKIFYYTLAKHQPVFNKRYLPAHKHNKGLAINSIATECLN